MKALEPNGAAMLSALGAASLGGIDAAEVVAAMPIDRVAGMRLAAAAVLQLCDAAIDRSEGRYSWTARVEVDPKWVADGFDLTAERLQGILLRELGYATEDEVAAGIVSAPDPEQIRAEQGYKVEGYRPMGGE